MGERLRTTAARHPGHALALLAAAAVLCSALAAGWTERLALSSSQTRKSGLQVRLGGAPPSSAPFQVALRTVRAQLSADPAVGTVRPHGGADPTSLSVRFDVSGRKRDQAIARIERNLDPGSFTVSFNGPAAAAREARDDALDASVLLLIALPVIALLAAVTLGIRGAGAALLAAASASAAAALACELLGGPFDVSWLALAGAVAGGSLVALQLCAMGGARAADLCASGIAAAAVFAACAALGVDYLTSLGLGGALATVLAVPASLAATGAAAGLEAPRGERAAATPWRGIATTVAWDRLVAIGIALLVTCLLAIAASPLDRLVSAAVGSTAAPELGAPRILAAAGGAAAACLLVALTFSRRPAVALPAALAATLPALAAVGLLVASFQEGKLEGPLDYSSNGALQLGSVAGAAAIVAALCAAQAVALACAARRSTPRADPVDWVAETMALCGPATALACLSALAAGVALGFSSPRFVKEFGLGAGAGLLIELLVVQALLAPALLRLAYRRPRDQ